MKDINAIKDVRLYYDLKEIHSRYKIGEKSDDFSRIKDIEPVFSFRYACLDKSDFSLASKLVSVRDYHKLIAALQEKSKLTYGTMDSNYNQHFHDLEWSDVTITESEFKKCISSQHSDNGDIDVTPYQFKVFQGARIIGFIYKTVFYVVMFDRGHNAYKRK